MSHACERARVQVMVVGSVTMPTQDLAFMVAILICVTWILLGKARPRDPPTDIGRSSWSPAQLRSVIAGASCIPRQASMPPR